MKITTIDAGKFTGALALLVLVAGCATSSPFSSSRRFDTPLAQLKPVVGSSVKSSQLPPLTQTNNSSVPLVQGNSGDNTQTGGPGRPGQVLLMPNGSPAELAVPDNQGSIVALEPNGVPANVVSRNLNGGLTIEKLLGSWTIISGADQCKINLTQTAKSNTGRYRASAPNCPISVLKSLASWQLVGSQVQFYNNSGQLIGALLQSGNRFIGTLAGGKGVSMVG